MKRPEACGGKKNHSRENWNGKLCDKHAGAKVWLVFDLARGWVWGPGHDTKAGQLARWTRDGDQK